MVFLPTIPYFAQFDALVAVRAYRGNDLWAFAAAQVHDA
jgi:hypothetical protein